MAEDAMEIPLARPDIGQAEVDAVVAVLRDPQRRLSLGPVLERFEQRFAEVVGTRFAVAVNSGTSALHLCVRALGIGQRNGEPDEVITTPFSFVASANCVLFEGARPVFVDICADTWNIDPERIESAITPRTRAILPVDIFGQCADMGPIREIADARGLAVIEDSCEALGGRYQGAAAGSLGDVGVFGFYPNKQITTGEGGMITTDRRDLAEMCRSLRNQGRAARAGWLEHERLGYNYRLSDINAALGLAQLARLDEILARRARVAEWYRQRLAEVDALSMQAVHPDVEMSWFVMVVRLSDDYDAAQRERIIAALGERGVHCGRYFPPIHLQPFYVERFGYRRGDFPVTEALADRTIALPFFGEMTEEQVDYVCRNLVAVL